MHAQDDPVSEGSVSPRLLVERVKMDEQEKVLDTSVIEEKPAFSLHFSEQGGQAIGAIALELGLQPDEMINAALGLYATAVKLLHGPGKENLRLAVVNPQLGIVHALLNVGGINKPEPLIVVPNGRPM